MKRLLVVAFVLLLAALAGYLWLQFGTREVPHGQPPLATMDLAELKAEFNRGAAQARVVVLLSPT
jgi:hypothetical protein